MINKNFSYSILLHFIIILFILILYLYINVKVCLRGSTIEVWQYECQRTGSLMILQGTARPGQTRVTYVNGV